MSKPYFKQIFQQSVWATLTRLPNGSFLVESEELPEFSFWFASERLATRQFNYINRVGQSNTKLAGRRLAIVCHANTLAA